jgi:hypothetical protein
VRTDPGTDIYVLAYRKAADDPALSHIRRAFLNNFLPAIHLGKLVVRGKAGASEWILNATTLPTHLHESSEASAFYRALLDPAPVVAESKRFGRLSLYINVDDGLEKSLHTITCRKPLMKIDTFRHTSIRVKYAAILECSDELGNKLLRELEPPQHHRWDPERAPGGHDAIRELKTFVREGLKSRVKEQIGDQVEITGLARYLPAPVVDTLGSGEGASAPVDGDGTDLESASVQGSPSSATPVINPGRKSVRVGVQTTADVGGDLPVRKGKDQGGSRSRRSRGGNLPGSGTPGAGDARISAGDVRFRSWTDAATGELCLAVTSGRDVFGDLELVALGAGGAAEDDYILPITAARLTNASGSQPIAHVDNTLKALRLTEGLTSHLRLTLSSNHRYRLGVKR